MAYSVGTPSANDATPSAANIATSGTITVGNGDTIVVFAGVSQDMTASFSASDGTNTYTRRQAQYNASNDHTEAILVAENVTAGTYTVTAAWDGGSRTNRTVYAIPLSGLKAASYQTGLTANQASPGTGADGVTTGNMTPSEQPACVIGFAFNVGSLNTPAAGTGFTSIGTAWQLGGGTDLMRAEHKRITSTSAVALTETAGANVRHTSLAVILSEAGATAGTATPGAGAATAAGLIPTLERERSITNRRFLV